MYSSLRNILPEDMFRIINDFIIDDTVIRKKYDIVIHEFKMYKIHKELKSLFSQNASS